MTDLIADVTSASEDKLDKLKQSYEKKRKKFGMNIIEFLVGSLLLVFCFNYLSDHPAEKSSIVSGIDVLYQKVKVFVSHMTTGKGKLLERKFEMERGFNELIYMGEDGKCVSESDLRKLYSYRDNIESMDASVFERQQFTYQNLLQTFYQKVLSNCDQYALDIGLERLGEGDTGDAE